MIVHKKCFEIIYNIGNLQLFYGKVECIQKLCIHTEYYIFEYYILNAIKKIEKLNGWVKKEQNIIKENYKNIDDISCTACKRY